MKELSDAADIVGADGADRDRWRLPHDASLRAISVLPRVTGGRLQRTHVHGICFHGIGTPRRALEPGEDRYWIEIDQFHAMLDVIAATPDVGISFDDGNASDLDIGLAGLRERTSWPRSSSWQVGSERPAASIPTVFASSSGAA